MAFNYRLTRTLVLALVFITPLCAAAAGPNYIPIAAARAQAQGTIVTIMGLVTVPSGNFRSSSEDEGFAIQDQTAGIWVSVKKDLGFEVGQRVLVTGTLGQRVGKLQIVPNSPADIELLGGVRLRVATGQVGIATLGYLISVVGTITQDGVVADLPYGAGYWVWQPIQHNLRDRTSRSSRLGTRLTLVKSDLGHNESKTY